MYPKSYLYHIRHGKIGPRPNNLLEFEQKKKKKRKKKREGMAHQAFIIEFLNLNFY